MVDTKSGYVYEKSLIEKYLQEKATCPMTGNEMTKDDLLPLKMGKPIKPRHSPQMSIPGILGMLHNVIFPYNASLSPFSACILPEDAFTWVPLGELFRQGSAVCSADQCGQHNSVHNSVFTQVACLSLIHI